MQQVNRSSIVYHGTPGGSDDTLRLWKRLRLDFFPSTGCRLQLLVCLLCERRENLISRTEKKGKEMLFIYARRNVENRSPRVEMFKKDVIVKEKVNIFMVGGLVWGTTNGVKVNTHAIEVYVFMFYQQKKRFRSRERESRGKEERYFLTIFGHLTNYTLVEGSVKIKEERSRSREFKTLCQSHDRRGKRRRAKGSPPGDQWPPK